MTGRDQSIFGMAVAVIHYKIRYLLLTKEIQSFFISPNKL